MILPDLVYMKILFTLLLLCSALPFGHALYHGNPALPKCPEEGFYLAKEATVGLRVGYEGDFVWNRKLNAHLHKFEIFENFGTATVTFLDRLDLYASGGSFSAQVRQQHEDARLEFDTQNGGVWKAGGRAVVYAYGETFVTVEAAYQQSRPALRDAALNGTPLERKGARLFYREVGASLGAAHKIDIFIPYLGIEGSYAWAKLSHLKGAATARIKAHSRYPVGLFLGCGLSPGARVIVNVEVRLVDEQAISLSGDLKF